MPWRSAVYHLSHSDDTCVFQTTGQRQMNRLKQPKVDFTHEPDSGCWVYVHCLPCFLAWCAKINWAFVCKWIQELSFCAQGIFFLLQYYVWESLWSLLVKDCWHKDLLYSATGELPFPLSVLPLQTNNRILPLIVETEKSFWNIT